MQLCAQLSASAAIPVNVPLFIVGGFTAQQNVDFDISSQSIFFPAGSLEECTVVSATDDVLLEENEMLTISLQTSNTVLLGQATTTITIIDQDSKSNSESINTLAL